MKIQYLALAFLVSSSHAVFAAKAPVTDLSMDQTPVASGEINQHSTIQATMTPQTQNAPQVRQQPSAFEMSLPEKIDTLQRELQRLHGQLETQGHDIKILKEQQRNFYKDLDERLGKLEKQNTASMHQKKKPVLITRSDLSSMEVYKKAIDLIREKKYTNAENQLKRYLSKYPNDKLIPNTHFWLGEIYYQQSNMEAAKKEFEIVKTQYPLSQKVPAALLKLGYIEVKEGNKQEAKKILGDIVKHFPDTPTAHLAQKKLDRI